MEGGAEPQGLWEWGTKFLLHLARGCTINEFGQLNRMSSGRGEIPHWRYSPRPGAAMRPLTR